MVVVDMVGLSRDVSWKLSQRGDMAFATRYVDYPTGIVMSIV